tara:strand:- start:914 stop:1714 length:801 start_codon:yes stop_codon:yes gene_type:complete
MVAVSRSNRRVRDLRKLLRKSSYRHATKTFVIEGLSLLREAGLTGNVPVDIFVAEGDTDTSAEIETLGLGNPRIWELDVKVLRSIGSTQNPQPVLATVPMFEHSYDGLIGSFSDFLAVGVEISDPGNAGTIIRTAAAAGANAVVFSQGSVDIYNPKVIRASAGSIFRIPVVSSVDALNVIQECHKQKIITVGLTGKGKTDYSAYDLTQPIALFVGNESRGLDSSLLGNLGAEVSIPMEAGVESLNAAVALSIVSFEVSRQRAFNDV